MSKVGFRIWDVNKEEWLDNENVFYNNGRWFETFRDAEDYTPFDETDIKVVQLTGLHDKNGKEIYEGDIVRVSFLDDDDDFVSVVRYYSDDGYPAFDLEQPTGWHFESNVLSAAMSDDYCVEVIGNIYENIELLESSA